MTYNSNAVYWIFLQKVIGVGSRKLLPIINRFKSARNFCESRYEDIRDSGLLSRKELDRFSKTTLDDCRKIMSECNRCGYHIITPNDKHYPRRLAQLPDPPAVLYICGEFPDFDNEVVLAMVGTRKCSETGKSIARELSYRLTTAGAIIISGGAIGIDTSSHIGALRAGGKTYAVLGCGLNYPYLTANAELRQDIAQNGALISEFPPHYPADKFTFPIRNRLISGLSLGVIVVEATRSSGSLITVDHALEQGKDIFVVPGEISDPLYAGSNRLIRDGAYAITNPQDVLCEYNSFYPHKLDLTGAEVSISCQDPAQVETFEEPDEPYYDEAEQPEVEKVYDTTGLSDTAIMLLDLFIDSDSEYFDVVIANCDIDKSKAIAALTELEIFGHIKACPGGRYILN